MTRILIIAGDFTSSGQLQYSYYRMKEENFDVTIAALEKKRLNTVIDMREEGWDLDTERRGYSFESDMTSTRWIRSRSMRSSCQAGAP